MTIATRLARLTLMAASITVLALAAIVLLSSPADAAQSPAGCTANDWDVSIGSPQIFVVDGTQVDYTVTVSNTGASACDIDEAVLTFTYPDGSTEPLTPGNACPALQSPDCYPANGSDVTFNLSYISNEVVDGNPATASVSGTAVLNRNPFGDEMASVDKNLALTFVHPAVEIIKDTALPGPFPQGSDVDINITVTNTGDVPLENLDVVDDTHPVCNRTITGAELTALFGNPWLPVNESFPYTCTVSAVMADVTDVATVTGNSVGNPNATVTDNDDAFIDVLVPAIEIVKGPDQTVISGDDAILTITVTNIGELDLTNVTVTDDTHPQCDAVIGDLAVGDSVSYQCTIPAVTADVTNTATVVGEPPAGPPVQDQDQATITVVNPAIEIVKGPDQTVVSGTDVIITITVTNVGDVDLENVTVTDDTHPQCDAVIGDLAVGASVSYQCTIPAVTADVTNTATAAGNPVGLPDDQVTDEDSAVIDVIAPAIEIVKGPDQTIFGEDTVTITITVTNTGDLDLTGVVVDDDIHDECDRDIGDLAVGESVSYQCTFPTPPVGDTVDTATVTGNPPVGPPVQDDDTATITVLAPATVGDFAWVDANGNGLQDAGEQPVAGLRVTLFTADGTEVGSTTTSSAGLYLFTGLAAGDYYVMFATPAGHTVTAANVGANDAIDSDIGTNGRTGTFTLDWGDDDRTRDAGFVKIAVAPEVLPVTGLTTPQFGWLGLALLLAGLVTVRLTRFAAKN